MLYSADGQLIESDAGYVGAVSGSVVLTSIDSQYVWGLNGANDLVLRDDSSTSGSLGVTWSGLGLRIYAISDANKNVMALADSGGSIVQWFGYDPYGAQYVFSSAYVSTTDGYNWEIGFQSGVKDLVTGLINFRARDYNPATAVWMQEEPFGSAYVDGVNLEQFTGSDPTSLQDPSGFATVEGSNSATFEQPEITRNNGHTRDTIIAEVTISVEADITGVTKKTVGSHVECSGDVSFKLHCRRTPETNTVDQLQG
jgi:RHS repeat-associated protein